VGRTAFAPNIADVFVKFAQTATNGGVKLVLDRITIDAQFASDGCPKVACISVVLPCYLCREKSCCSW
jgi:hypothetical protein